MGAKKYLPLLAVLTGAIASATVILSPGDPPLLAQSPNGQPDSIDAPQPHYGLEFIPVPEEIGEPRMQSGLRLPSWVVCGGNYDDEIEKLMPTQSSEAIGRTVSPNQYLRQF